MITISLKILEKNGLCKQGFNLFSQNSKMNQQPVDIQTRETDEKQLEMTYKCTIVYEKKSCK